MTSESPYPDDRGEPPAYTAKELDERWRFGRAIRPDDAFARVLNESWQSSTASRGQVYLILRPQESDHGVFAFYAVLCRRVPDMEAANRNDLVFVYDNAWPSTPDLRAVVRSLPVGGRPCPLIRDHGTKAPRLHRALWHTAPWRTLQYLPGFAERIWEQYEDEEDPDVD